MPGPQLTGYWAVHCHTRPWHSNWWRHDCRANTWSSLVQHAITVRWEHDYHWNIRSQVQHAITDPYIILVAFSARIVQSCCSHSMETRLELQNHAHVRSQVQLTVTVPWIRFSIGFSFSFLPLQVVSRCWFLVEDAIPVSISKADILTPWSRVLFRELIVTQVGIKFPLISVP